MPTILRQGKYRFFFFSNEGNEPSHIHIESGDSYAKFWLNPVALEKSSDYSSRELTRIYNIVLSNKEYFNNKWNAYFS